MSLLRILAIAHPAIVVKLGSTPEVNRCVSCYNTLKSFSFQTLRQFTFLYHEAVMSDYNQNNDIMEYTDFVFPYAYHCHEATLAFTYALNKTIAGKCLHK